MSTQTFTIEKRNRHIASIKDTIGRIVTRNGANKQGCINDLSEVVGSDLKLGYGGSHIWCCNQKNERIFIVTGY